MNEQNKWQFDVLPPETTFESLIQANDDVLNEAVKVIYPDSQNGKELITALFRRLYNEISVSGGTSSLPIIGEVTALKEQVGDLVVNGQSLYQALNQLEDDIIWIGREHKKKPPATD